MKTVIASILAVIILFIMPLPAAKAPQAKAEIVFIDTASDVYVRDAVIKLIGARGTCSAIQVQDAKGQLLVVSAAHCRPLVDEDGMIKAEGEDGRTTELKFLVEDDHSDLILFKGSKKFGHIAVAKKSPKLHEKLHTLTHGGGAPTFRTDGEALDEVGGGFMIDIVGSEGDILACISHAKYTIVPDPMTGAIYCVLDVKSLRTTAQAIPGSSGGALLNEAGELVGITSYGNPQQATFAYYVRLVDIQAFLKAI